MTTPNFYLTESFSKVGRNTLRCAPSFTKLTPHEPNTAIVGYSSDLYFFQSFVDAAVALKERGAYKIYALATHGILSADAPRLIEESPINEVNTFCHLC